MQGKGWKVSGWHPKDIGLQFPTDRSVEGQSPLFVSGCNTAGLWNPRQMDQGQGQGWQVTGWYTKGVSFSHDVRSKAPGHKVQGQICQDATSELEGSWVARQRYWGAITKAEVWKAKVLLLCQVAMPLASGC